MANDTHVTWHWLHSMGYMKRYLQRISSARVSSAIRFFPCPASAPGSSAPFLLCKQSCKSQVHEVSNIPHYLVYKYVIWDVMLVSDNQRHHGTCSAQHPYLLMLQKLSGTHFTQPECLKALSVYTCDKAVRSRICLLGKVDPKSVSVSDASL